MYATFIAQPGLWHLYEGIGTAGKLIGEKKTPPNLSAFGAAANAPVLWVTGRHTDAGERFFVERISLPELDAQTLAWDGGRIGAIACNDAGDRAAVVELPSQVGQQTTIWEWDGSLWQSVPCPIPPDISSGLCWLDAVIA